MNKLLGLFLVLLPTLALAQGAEVYYSEAGMYPGEGGSPLEPNAKLSMGALQQVINAPTFYERTAPLANSVALPTNPITSDYELESFSKSISNTDGFSHNLRIAWGHTTPNQAISYGARANAQVLRVTSNLSGTDSTVTFFNCAPGAFAEKVLVRKMDLLVSAGSSLDLMVYGDGLASPMLLDTRFGGLLTGYGRATKWFGIHKITGGANIQESYQGRVMQTNLGLAALWIASPKPYLDTKVEVLFKTILFQHTADNLYVQLQNRSEMRLGLGLSYWLTETMSLDVTYRATLLVQDIDVQTFALGSRFAF